VPGREQAGNAAALLSTTGALVLGVGIGALLGQALGPVAWILAGIGLVAHLSGMVAVRRIRQHEGYRFAAWETWSYWICWALIGLGAVAGLAQLLGREVL